MNKPTFISAICLVCVSIAFATGSTAGASDIEVDHSSPVATEPDRTPRRATAPREETRARSSTDRCRSIIEYAQLGEFDETDLQFLRRSCD